MPVFSVMSVKPMVCTVMERIPISASSRVAKDPLSEMDFPDAGTFMTTWRESMIIHRPRGSAPPKLLLAQTRAPRRKKTQAVRERDQMPPEQQQWREPALPSLRRTPRLPSRKLTWTSKLRTPRGITTTVSTGSRASLGNLLLRIQISMTRPMPACKNCTPSGSTTAPCRQAKLLLRLPEVSLLERFSYANSFFAELFLFATLTFPGNLLRMDCQTSPCGRDAKTMPRSLLIPGNFSRFRVFLLSRTKGPFRKGQYTTDVHYPTRTSIPVLMRAAETALRECAGRQRNA